MVERRLTQRDQAGLPQPARAGLLASTSGARETNAARETTAAGASLFAFLSHIARSQQKQRISHQTSDRSCNTSAGDWWWHVYTNNVAATITNGADPSDNRPWGYFLAWTSCSEPQNTGWLIILPQLGGHEEDRTHWQRVVYARALLQVRRGGRTTSNMPYDTNVSTLLVRWASDTYTQCLLPQLLWCMPLHVMFPLPTTSLHLVRPAPCCMCWLRTICTANMHRKQKERKKESLMDCLKQYVING